MTVREMSALSPETAVLVEGYLARLEAGLCAVRREMAEDTLAETRAHFLDALDATSTPAEAEAVAAGLGDPDEYAAALCAEIAGDEGVVGLRPGSSGWASGTVLGLPYEFRAPTAERVREAWWNPSDPRIAVPSVFGIGWDVNFAALAVRLHLIRPDDEEAPFASVPEGWLRAALAVPLFLTVGMGIAWWITAASLPAELPTHWNLAGEPDDFSPSAQALGFLMVMAVVPSAWALRNFLRRSDGSRAIVSAFAAFFAALAAGIFATTLLWVYSEPPGWLIETGILGSLFVPFVMLVVLARVNRREEWKKELGR